MKVLIDTCVLYPTVMREMLLGAAEAGVFQPLWSARIIAEWQHAAGKLGPAGAAQAAAEAAVLGARWPGAEVRPAPGLEDRLWLPDPADIPVLAAAVSGSADLILTLNAKDFPRHILAEEGVGRADPDGFLLGVHAAQPSLMPGVASRVRAEAERLSGAAWPQRTLLKKARLPRLAKALEA